MFSFITRKKSLEVRRRLRRLCDQSTMALNDKLEGPRRHCRVSRSLPVVVAPWLKHAPDMGRCLIVVTKDFADEGVSLISTHPLPAGEVVLGLWAPEPDAELWFFRGTLRHSTAIGGGFWTLGVELTQLADSGDPDLFAPLMPYALKLSPPAPCEAPA